jgi:hypothetical protein
MASERDRPTTPGWYWCQLDYVSSWSPHHTDYICDDGEYLTWGPPCTGYPGAEHPDAALRERLGALADAWWDKANRLQARADETEFHEQARFQVAADMARADANELRRALLTEGQPPAKETP